MADRFIAPTKQPAEIVTYGVDFSRRAAAGEVLSGYVPGYPVARDYATGADVTADLIAGAWIDGNTAFVRVRGGEHGRRYRVTLLVATSAGHRWEADIIVGVRDL
jgi:hypothetical protein